MRIIELRRRRAALIAQAKGILAGADSRGGMTEDERREIERVMTEAESLRDEISRLEAEERAGPQPGQYRGNRPIPDGQLGMSNREVAGYSILRAVRGALRARLGDADPWRDAGLELEASRAEAARRGIEPRGVFVPFDVLQHRDMNVTLGSGQGSNLVGTDHLGGSFIDLLRARTVVVQAGATMLTGLVGNVDIPKLTAGHNAHWVGEGGAATESTPTTGSVELAPHTVSAYSDFTRRLMLQSDPSVEGLLRNDLARVLAEAIDYAALHGDSSDDVNQPDGIEHISGVGTPAGGLDWAGVVGLESEIGAANADVGRLAYITNSSVRGVLKATSKAGTEAIFVWGESNQLNGYRALVSNIVKSDPENYLFFGNWGDLLIGQWSGLDILVDPYSHSTSGTVRIVAFQDVDVNVRHAESFAFVSV